MHQIRKYWPDFVVTKNTRQNDYYYHIEFKGLFTAADRKKMLLVKEQHLFTDIRIVFQQDNKISKKSKTRYSDWAKKHGFKYHVGISLPKSWIKEFKG